MVHWELCFFDWIEPRIKISSQWYQNKPNFHIWCNITPSRKLWIFNWFWGGLLMVHSKLCFCGRIESTFKFHLISFLFFSFYATDMIEDNNKMKYNFFFCLDATNTNTFGLFVQIQSIQSGHLGSTLIQSGHLGSTLTCCRVGIFGRCS
jgi:hypothetical protein